MHIYSRIIPLLLTLLVGCYHIADTPTLPDSISPPTISIEDFRDEYVGSHCQIIPDDVVLHGRVTSSDACDNFYRTIVIEDSSAAVELLVGLYDLHTLYPEGLLVALHVEGLAASYSRGVLQLGRKAPDNSPHALDYLESRTAADRVIERSGDVTKMEPTPRSIATLNRHDCGKLVHFDSLRMIDTSSIDTLIGQTLADARWRGYTLFEDRDGDSIVVYTGNYASFADHTPPQGLVSLRGIVQSINAGDHFPNCQYQIKMRYEEDCSTY